MKDIQSQTIQDIAPTKLSVEIVFDDLSTHANFLYRLLNDSGEEVKSEILLCDGTDYTNWKGDNEYPYTFVAGKLGINIK